MSKVKKWYIGVYGGEAQARPCSPAEFEIIRDRDPRYFVTEDDFDRVTAERDALQHRLTAADEQIDLLYPRHTEQPEGKREHFEKWVMATKHPVYGFLDGRSLARGDDRTGYADEYVQGLWVAYLAFGAEQLAPIAALLDERDEFVSWVRQEWPQAPLSNVRDLLPKDDPRYGEYCDEALQRAWVGWQARAAVIAKS